MNGEKKEILVADDEAGFRALFKFMLEPRGFIVSTVNDGAEALESVEKSDYALIFLDVHMPRMTGPEALKKIRELKPAQPVVILSSSAEPDKVAELTRGLGASACFQKPFNTNDIFQIIEDILGTSLTGKRNGNVS